MNHSKPFKLAILPVMISALSGCGDDNLDPNAINAPNSYTFSHPETDNSTVAFLEATTRNLLIEELSTLIQSDYLQTLGQTEGQQAVISKLNQIYQTGTMLTESDNLAVSDLYTGDQSASAISNQPDTSLAIQQSNFSQLTSDINLQSKMPGIAYPLHYTDSIETAESTPENPIYEDIPDFYGWALFGINSDNEYPDRLIQEWFKAIASLAIDNDDSTRTTNTTNGINYERLIAAFLDGAIRYGQATSEHLASDALSADNTRTDTYTELEHQWDLAYGYLGANTHAPAETNTELTESLIYDINQDDSLDLSQEYRYSFIQAFAQRDIDSPLADTRYAQNLLDSLVLGRFLISQSANTGTLESRVEEYRLKAIQNWEKALAATIIHHLNLAAKQASLYKADSDDYNETEYFDNWSTMKGYALALQFNPDTSISQEDLETIIFNMDQQVDLELTGNGFLNDLFESRSLLADNLGFSNQNVASW